MQIETETERKYDVPGAFALPKLVGRAGVARLGAAQTHDLDATYFDTETLHLARHRLTLRRRTGGSDAGWHLKTPGGGNGRVEHRLPLGDDADAVPEELTARVRAVVRTAALRPVTRLHTRRVETPLLDEAGRTLALLAQDEVRAESDGAEQSWTEIEVELVDGDERVLRAVEKRLLAAGATPAAGPSKLARALGDRLDTRPAAAASEPVFAYATEQRDAIVANDPAVRDGDPEGVHRMRVATRRLRSTLKTFRDHWEAERAAHLRAELKWLADLLGGVRDGQVLTRRLADAADREGPEFAPVGERLRSHLGATVDSGRDALNAALDDSRYLRLLDDLDALVDPKTTAGRSVPARSRLRRARKALAKADGLLDAASRPPAGGGDEHRDEHLHDARKAYKQARYAVEVFVPQVGAPAKGLAARLTRLQDVLGDHQDSAVARDLLRDVAGSAHADGENGFAYGVLYARQEQAGEAVLVDLPDAVRRSRRRKLRSWLG